MQTQLAGRPASHAGDPKLRHQVRRFGVVRFDDGTGIFDATYKQFASVLARSGTKIAIDLKYQLDLNQAQEIARTLIAALKKAHVTSVVLAGDPIFPSFLTHEATAQNYFPEWVVLGYAYTDTAVFGRTYDQRQWAHAFGVSLLPARTTDAANEFANVLRWQFGVGPEAKTYQVLVQSPLIFFTGVHLAGPHLTAQTFRDALFSYPSSPTTSPTVLHTSWGKHGIWPGTDYTWGDDLTVIWWDPERDGTRRGRQPGPRHVPVRARRAPLPSRPVAGRRRALRHRALGDDLHVLAARESPAELSLAGVDPRRLSAGSVVHDPRRVADRDAEVGERPGHHRAGADDDVSADPRAGQDDRAVPEPGAGADGHRLGWRELLADREAPVLVAVVGVRDVDVMAGEHVVADLDALVADDSAALADEAAVPDPHDGAGRRGPAPATRRPTGVAYGPTTVPAPSSM